MKLRSEPTDDAMEDNFDLKLQGRAGDNVMPS